VKRASRVCSLMPIDLCADRLSGCAFDVSAKESLWIARDEFEKSPHWARGDVSSCFPCFNKLHRNTRQLCQNRLADAKGLYAQAFDVALRQVFGSGIEATLQTVMGSPRRRPRKLLKTAWPNPDVLFFAFAIAHLSSTSIHAAKTH
jgi:hypothetical protein